MTNRQIPSLLVFLIWCSGIAAPALAQNPAPNPADAYVKQFESSYHDVRTLRADFTQTYTQTGNPRVESGWVALARGGLMRWEYQQPAKKLFISDGKYVSLYIPEERQVTRTPMKSSEDFRVPFELLLSRLDLRRVFAKVELADAALPHDPTHRVLRGFPKKQFEGDYSSVLIELDPQFDVRRLVVTYADHSQMDFRFDNIHRNVPLPPSLFRFTPPPGTQVIDQPQG